MPRRDRRLPIPHGSRASVRPSTVYDIPVRRRLLNLLTALSLLLCFASAVEWVRSHRVSDLAFWTSRDVTWSARVVTGSGGVGFVLEDQQVGNSEVSRPGWHWDVTSPPGGYARGGWRTRLGFTASGGGGIVGVAVPFWFLCLLFALPPAATLALRRRAKRRAAEGKCRVCGYDLRATPERCPECGAANDSDERIRSCAASG